MFDFFDDTVTDSSITAGAAYSASEPDIVRRICAALRPPNDRPNREVVMAAVSHCVANYARQVCTPSPALVDLLDDLAELPDRSLNPSARALGQRSRRYAAWHAALLIGDDTAPLVTEAFGAVMVRALLSDAPVSVAAASRIIRACRSSSGQTLHIALQQDVNRTNQLVEMGDRAQLPLRDRIRGFYRILLSFGGEHAHQCRPSVRSVRLPRYRLAATMLKAQVGRHEPRAMWQLLAIVTGLPVVLVAALPLTRNHGLDPHSPAWLDLDTGVYHLDLAVIAPGGRAAPGGATECVAASEILARPLPTFAHHAIAAHAAIRPEATTVGDLLGQVEPGQCAHIIADFHGGVRPTLARLQGSTEMIARHLGIASAYAAHLSGRYQSHPSTRNYYQLIHGHDLWNAAGILFDALGWGPPVARPALSPAGARAVATDASVMRWHRWMCDTVREAYPGNRCGADRLLQFHNAYARATASIVAFCLALRYVDQIPLQADIDLDAGWTLMADKRSRTAWNATAASALPHCVPLCALLVAQLRLWRRHCEATARRLSRYASAPQPLTQAINAVADSEPVPAMVAADGQRAHVIGSAQLVQWWPADFARDGNWARAWWASKLVSAHTRGDLIDLLLRHELAGVNRGSNVDDTAQAARLRELRRTQERICTALALHPIRGLAA